MGELASLIFGPLVVPECRRAAGRGWIIVVRTAAASVLLFVALSFLWWWWFNGLQPTAPGQPAFLPYGTLRAGVATLEVMGLVIALLMAPAVLAGSLAGDKERGSLGLLLTTRVNALEIVLGRLAGKLAQVGSILLACVPALVLMIALAGLRLGPTLMLFALLAATMFGAGGLAVGASAISRRGRDALLSTYLFELLLILAAAAAEFDPRLAWLGVIDPFDPVIALAWGEDVGPALAASAFWLALGLAGLAVAAWRLRSACLRMLGGDPRGNRRARRGWWVPPVDERRPMLWKELFVERAGSLGRFGRWVGLLLVVGLIGGSLGLAGMVVYFRWIDPDPELESLYTTWLGRAIADQGRWVRSLITLALALRGAVAVSSERERGTWDALLTSPLQGGEIVVGKLWGSLHSLRWLIGAALWAWGLSLVFGAMSWYDFLYELALLLTAGALAAGLGVRVSLATSTATRAMAVAVGLWLGALCAIATLAAVVLATLTIVCLIGVGLLSEYGFLPGTLLPRVMNALWSVGWRVLYPSFYLAAALAVVAECRVRFDRVAGRMTGGDVAVQVDQFLHGTPMAPVPIDVARPAERAEVATGDGGIPDSRIPDPRMVDA